MSPTGDENSRFQVQSSMFMVKLRSMAGFHVVGGVPSPRIKYRAGRFAQLREVFFFAIWLPILPLAATAQPSSINRVVNVNDVLEPIIAKYGIPGMAAVALQGDLIIAQGVAGVRKAGAPQPISPWI
jgi:hypothetical protein